MKSVAQSEERVSRGGRNSDYVIVAMKLGNSSGAKGVARRSKCNMKKLEPHTEVGDLGRHSEDKEKTQTIRRALIAVKARSNPKEQFNNLVHHLTPELVLQRLARIPAKSAPGIDGMTVTQALENLDWLLPSLLEKVHKGSYEAPPVRRVYIPKATGGQRPLGVPEVLDRGIQSAVATILCEIYEQDFLKCSFGFRPKIGCHHALATIQELLDRRGMKYALEVDIRDFFGSLKHEWLRKFLGLRISDSRVLKLIDSWLRAGVIEKDKWHQTVDGTPQGGSITP
jgi:retron-type reverse transcriptase